MVTQHMPPTGGSRRKLKMNNTKLHLASRSHNYSDAYDYDWYPHMTHEEAKALLMSYEDKRLSAYDPYASIYCIEGEDHKQNFIDWKESLENRTQAFAHEDMRINDENVAKLEPRGYIVKVTEPNND